MDKQRVLEIALKSEAAHYYDEVGNEYTFDDAKLQKFTAAILLEAAKVCNDTSEILYRIDNRAGCFMCKNKLERIAKELTQ